MAAPMPLSLSRHTRSDPARTPNVTHSHKHTHHAHIHTHTHNAFGTFHRNTLPLKHAPEPPDVTHVHPERSVFGPVVGWFHQEPSRTAKRYACNGLSALDSILFEATKATHAHASPHASALECPYLLILATKHNTQKGSGAVAIFLTPRKHAPLRQTLHIHLFERI